MSGWTDSSLLRWIRLGVSGLALGSVLAAIALVTPAEAATIAVTTTSDELNNAAPCSLREAIRAANTDTAVGGCTRGSGADTITLPAGTYTLTIANLPGFTDEDVTMTGDLDIVSTLSISGAGEGSTVIDGNGTAVADRVFDVSGSASASFNRLTIRNGSVPTSEAGGGGVSNDGSATFTSTTITGNRAGFGGGGVSNGSGSTSAFRNSTISGNTAEGGSGGGVRNGSGASSTFAETSIIGNTAQVGGGGVSNDGSATFVSTTIGGNSAGSEGGGVFNGAPAGTSTFANSTISGNSARLSGGGVFNRIGATSNLTNATISGNRANDSGGGMQGGTATLSNATVTSNTADADVNGTGDGGGVADATLTTKNSIIAGNIDASAPPGMVSPDCRATVTSQGYNLIANPTGCTISAGPGDKVGSSVDAGLAPLGNNGGPTATHALLATSQARDAGSPSAPGASGGACAPTDQRGVPRPQTSRCDIGAYELATCLQGVVNRVGTRGKDVLMGTSGPDAFLALGGGDRINGKGGTDRACGGSGKDLLMGGGGIDVLAGGSGPDLIVGGGGADRLHGRGGRDVLLGGGGRDRCVGGSGKDRARSCERKKGIP